MPDPRPIILTAAQVRSALAGETLELRRKLRPGEWLFDGHPIGRNCQMWRRLLWPTAFLDDGPSPAGNPGPYWKVLIDEPNPDWQTRHRLYPRIRPGDRLRGILSRSTPTVRSSLEIPLVVTGLRLEPGEERPFVVEARRDG